MNIKMSLTERAYICKDACVFCPRLETCNYVFEPGLCPKEDSGL